MAYKKKNYYVQEEELNLLLVQWREDKPLGKQMSNRLGELALEIARGILKKNKYFKISKELKEDIVGETLINFIKYIHNYKPENSMSRNPAFTYCTYCLETTIRSTLGNKKRQFADDMLSYEAINSVSDHFS